MRNVPQAVRQLDYLPHEKPQMSFQIFDNSEDRIVEAAIKIESLGPGIIDLNMGCSVSGVSGRGAGAGLLREPDKIGRIFNRMSKAVHVPVTGKIRLGWDATTRNYLTVAKILEDNGASLIAVHGRTKEQAYKGVADWDPIRIDLQIKDSSNKRIWLIDVKCPYDMEKNISNCKDRNIAKYSQFRNEIQDKYKSWQVTLETLVFGSLGSWDPENNAILRSLKLNLKIIKQIAEFSSINCIKWSNQIWKQHATVYKRNDETEEEEVGEEVEETENEVQ